MATKKKPAPSPEPPEEELDPVDGDDVDMGDDMDELGEDDLGDDELGDDDMGDPDLADDDLGDEFGDGEEEGAEDLEDEAAARPALPAGEDDDDDDDELDPDDVEASLDDILKDRLVIEDNETDDDDVVDADDRTEGTSGVVPKRPDEFVCQSCFLVKHPSQIADQARQLCRDCV